MNIHSHMHRDFPAVKGKPVLFGTRRGSALHPGMFGASLPRIGVPVPEQVGYDDGAAGAGPDARRSSTAMVAAASAMSAS